MPLDYIIVAAHSDDSELIKTLFSNGVDVKQNQYLFSRALREGLKILTCYPFANGRSCDDTKVLLLKSVRFLLTYTLEVKHEARQKEFNIIQTRPYSQK